MTQQPPKRNPAPIGSDTPSRRLSDGKPIVYCQTTGARDFLSPANGNRRFWAVHVGDDSTPESAQAWHNTEPDLTYAVVQADQARDPLADVVLAVLSIIGVAMLLSWLWWASHGGKWVAPW